MIRVGHETIIPSVSMKDASFPSPFASELEFSVPARGTWTIVHVGMLVPEAHEIFVCGAGCLRGVVLSAAEMNLTNRFSTVAIEEHNVVEGDMEDLIIDGVTDILNRLPHLPKSVLVYSSCIHLFMGCDLDMCFNVLRERFPSVDFTDCYMNPTMRKSGLTPDRIMRRQLYSLLKPVKKKDKHCAIVGNCFSIEDRSDLARLIGSAGWTVHQITDCKTYEEYLKMAECTVCISTQSVAEAGGTALGERLDMKHLYLPVSYESEEIRKHMSDLADTIGASYDGDFAEESEADEAMNRAKALIGDTPIAIDYTFTSRPLELAKRLIKYGFNVVKLFADSFSGEEKEAYLWLGKNAPEIEVSPTVHPAMRRYPYDSEEKVLALGQKAAYFTDTPYFVNIVENGSLYGFDGIKHLAKLMEEAFTEPKDTERIIGIKGLECETCL